MDMETDSSSEGDGDAAPQPIRVPIGHRPVIFPVPGSFDLTARVLAHLGWQRGLCSFKVFENGEINAKVGETVANHDVFVLYARDDENCELNFSLVQLLFFVAAVRSESPHRLTVILPCLDYSRQDRRLHAGQGIPPQLLLRLLKGAGADRFLTTDLHNEAEAAFTPDLVVLDELSSLKYMSYYLRHELPGFDPTKAVVCATNGGGLVLTRRMASELKTGFVMADRKRPKEGGTGEVKVIVSSPIDHMETIIIVDDMMDTCSTMAEVCRALHKMVPTAKIYGIAMHGYFCANAHELMRDLVTNFGLQWIAVTNSVTQTGALQRFADAGIEGRLKVVDISRMLAGAVGRIHLGASVNLPKFRSLSPADHDTMLQPCGSPGFALARRGTDEGSLTSPRLGASAPPLLPPPGVPL